MSSLVQLERFLNQNSGTYAPMSPRVGKNTVNMLALLQQQDLCYTDASHRNELYEKHRLIYRKAENMRILLYHAPAHCLSKDEAGECGTHISN